MGWVSKSGYLRQNLLKSNISPGRPNLHQSVTVYPGAIPTWTSHRLKYGLVQTYLLLSYLSKPIEICFGLLLLLLLLRNEFVLGCCICTCTLYVFVFVLYMYLYLYLRYICICICPGGPKGPHLVAEGHQPSAGARSLAPIGGQTF